jgi:hypothetical protein
MAKPRVFVSSTYYDLKYIRAGLEEFIWSLGYEPILFESGNIPFAHDVPLDVSCNNAVDTAHIFVLIVGGRYGSRASRSENSSVSEFDVAEGKRHQDESNSITLNEYERARNRGVPIYTFIERDVAGEYETYKKNTNTAGVAYAYVDDIKIFKFIERIYSQPINNQIKKFESFNDIASWLRSQWAGMFAEYLSKEKTDIILNDLSSQINNLGNIAKNLQAFSLEIFKKLEPEPERQQPIVDPIQKQLLFDMVFSNGPMSSYLQSHYKWISRKIDIDNIDEVVDQIVKCQDYPQFKASLIEKDNDTVMAEGELGRFEVYPLSLYGGYRNLRKSLSELPQLRDAFKGAPPVIDPLSSYRHNAFTLLSDRAKPDA